MSRADDMARDALARRRAQVEFDGFQVVEAGAGTGKTAVLVARIIAWCIGPGWERTAARLSEGGEVASAAAIARELLGRVVAITFTEAAAAEMSARVSEGLLQVRLGELPVGLLEEAVPADAEPRAQALLDASDQIVIQTIHAFCRRLLVAHPIAAGLHPRFEVDADEAGLQQIAREVIEGHLQHAYGPGGDPDAFALGVAELGPRALEGALLALLQNGATPDELADPLAPLRVARWRRAFLEALAEFELAEDGRIHAAGRAQEETAQRLRLTKERLAGLTDDAEALLECAAELREAWPETERLRLREWEKGKFPKKVELGEARAGVMRAVETLRPFVDQLLTTDFEILVRGHRVLRPLVAQATSEMRRRGVQSFAALLRDAAALLSESPGIAAGVRAGIDQILVDEFQDTDALQCEILQQLAAPEGPSIFVVGDPKQSIYGWRNADLAAYRAFVESLVPEGEQRGILCVNHRSVQPILDEVERCIEPLLGEGNAWQAAFQPLHASPARSADPGFEAEGAAAVEHWDSSAWTLGSPAEKTRSAEATRLEADAVAADIAGHVAAGRAAPGDFGILLRGLGDLEAVLSALRRAGVPYIVERDQGYYQRREIIDASALVRWLLDPNDTVALVAVLRSGIAGVPDAALVPLWSAGLPDAARAIAGPDDAATRRCHTVIAEVKLPAGVPGLERIEGWRESAIGFLARVGALREAAANEAPDRFVERLRRSLLVEASEAARHLGRFRLANLDRFFRDLARALDTEDPSAVLRRLRTSVSTAREDEEGRPRDVDDRAVHVLSIHKSKGLAFEHVYVMQLHRGHGGSDRRRTTVARRGSRCALTLFGERSLEVPLIARDQAATEMAERERILYVAMTRARRRLVLVGKRDARPDHKAPVALLAKRRGAPDVAALAERVAGAPEGDRAIEADGALWVFPHRAPIALAAARTTEGTDAADARLAAAVRDAETVAERCATAQLRMARPAVLRASAEHASWAGERSAEGTGTEPALSSADGSPLGARERLTDSVAAPPDERDAADARTIAMFAGTAVHAALERYEPSLGAVGEDAARRALAAVVAGVPPQQQDEVGALASAGWERFRQGPLHAQFERISPGIVARELPVLLPPGAVTQAAVGPTGPEAGSSGAVGFVSGAIDLVYRDPAAGGAWVVADYKSDHVEGDAVAERAAKYTGQARLYVHAVAEALGLDAPPRFELWFLHSGQIVDLGRPAA